ncbi:MAG TPA: UbiA family prenyltransferase [Acidimicrobiales bacterium]|nr:UbiA family prenyltransferase [Acidimicrobiales bacterium]
MLAQPTAGSVPARPEERGEGASMEHPSGPPLRLEGSGGGGAPHPGHAFYGVRRRMWAVLRLTRAENCVVAGFATLVGAGTARSAAGTAGTAGAAADGATLVGSVAAVMLVLAFGNVVNDLADVDADRLGKSGRPLPSGRITMSQAWSLAAALLAAAVVVTLATPHRQLLFVLAMAAVAALYSPFLKRVPLLGNVTVAAQCGATLIFGARAAGAVSPDTIGASLLVAAGMLCVEVAKTVEDHDADRQVGTRTVAHLVDTAHHPGLVAAFAASYLVVGSVLWSTAEAPGRFSLAAVPVLPLLAVAVHPRASGSGQLRSGRPVRASKYLWPLTLVALTGL